MMEFRERLPNCTIVFRFAILNLQRVFRGHKGRKIIKKVRALKEAAHKILILNYFISLIQKTFRGFRDRKSVLDYYERKKYLVDVVVIAEDIRSKLDLYHQACLKVVFRSLLYLLLNTYKLFSLVLTEG